MFCKTCNVTFKRKSNYNRHVLSAFHIEKEKKGITSAKNHICPCGKAYSTTQSLCRHKKSCTYTPTKSSEVIIDEMQQRLDNFEKERDELRAQISLLLDKQAGTTTNTNSNNTNIENQNNTINININAFGSENTDYLDDQAILQCIDRVYKSIPALLQKIHFDPQHPENHNIKITNKKLPYASVMGHNQRWKTMDRKDAIDKMVNNGYYMLDEKYEVNKEKFDPRKQKNFEGFKDKFETEEKNTMKMVKGDVEMMVLNGGT